MIEKITNNADETNVQDLLASQCLFEVPYFQRSYKWKPQKLLAFGADLSRLADDRDSEEIHFIGAVIIQGHQAPPTVARTYQVIDGQQRLTTIVLFLLGIIRAHLELDAFDKAASLFKTFLITSLDTREKSNLKLHPSGADRHDLNKVVKEVLDFKNFRTHLEPIEIKFLTPGQAVPNTRISKNFIEVRKFLKNEVANSDQPIVRLEHLYTALLQSITLVQIDVKDPLMGPVIFDRLNSGQEAMTVGELVKNDVMSRGINIPDGERQRLEQDIWQPFFLKFGAAEKQWFDTYLFPFGLIKLNPNVRKGDVYRLLRTNWNEGELTTEQVVSELASLQDEYLDLCDGLNRCGFDQELSAQVGRLVDVGLPTMMFSFVMRLLSETKSGSIEQSEAVITLKHIESFIVRRGAFGLEPSGLHAAFKGMWSEIQHAQDAARGKGEDVKPIHKLFVSSIARRTTVKWPTTEEFENSLRIRSLYGSKVTRYILSEYNRSLPGDHSGVDGVEIEHILPQTISENWSNSFTSAEHDLLLNRLGNLTLLTQRMNKDVSNRGYQHKKEIYEGSKYVMTRKIGNDYEIWTPDKILERTEMLVNWSISRWPEQ
jgi:hypothetical protein